MTSTAEDDDCGAPKKKANIGAEIKTLIFDIDDTLYTASSGFSEHRNGEVIKAFMVEKLGFASANEAKALRDEYFKKYHSTMKGLAVATEEGRLPKPFVKEELAEYWAEHCDFAKYLSPMTAFSELLRCLRDEVGFQLVAFSNSPRKYALQVLAALGLRELFTDDRVYGVEDVLPACKPEPKAFEKVLAAVGARPEQAVMFEDSMKNIRACKAIGLHTVLIDETRGQPAVTGSEAALLSDCAQPDDPSVDAVLQNINEIKAVLPELWQGRFFRKCK